jgi:hypothetical protein
MADELKIYALGEVGLSSIVQSVTRTGGGDGSGNGVEGRIAKLESDVSHICDNVREIKTDLRALLAALVGVFLILGGMIIYGYFRLSDQISTSSILHRQIIVEEPAAP